LIKEATSKDSIIILKAMLVLLKVILTCRTNTVRVLDKLGIPREDTKKEQQTTTPRDSNTVAEA
ncbi:MAG TPA: hypothetical protein VGB37_07300, partial [Candidatus Lokiarchaeia archaeon]